MILSVVVNSKNEIEYVSPYNPTTRPLTIIQFFSCQYLFFTIAISVYHEKNTVFLKNKNTNTSVNSCIINFMFQRKMSACSRQVSNCYDIIVVQYFYNYMTDNSGPGPIILTKLYISFDIQY